MTLVLQRSFVILMSCTLLLLFNSSFGARIRNNFRRPQTSCRFLRHVYKHLWYAPQCEEDDSLKNPLCYSIAGKLRVCCCTHKYPIVEKGIRWLGDCTRYPRDSTAMPHCKGPRMVSKYGGK